MNQLKTYLKNTSFIIRDETNYGAEKLRILIQKFKRDPKIILFAKKTVKNYDFFKHLDESTENNNRYFIGHYGNYATWLNENDLTPKLLTEFLNQSIAAVVMVHVDKKVDMNNYAPDPKSSILRDGKSISLSPSITIL